MRVGVVFPQNELGGDVGAVRAYGQEVEALGYDHLLAYDHVVGADPAVHVGWDGYYDVDTTFHEPLVMFGYLAAVTTTLEFVTGVLILPQRQTALVAKQAAEVDLLSQGRFRLGVGIGWNAVEYDALGEDFGVTRCAVGGTDRTLAAIVDRAQRHVRRARFDTVTGAGLAPLPVQRPIPVWIGTASAKGYERIGRIADGWFPMMWPRGRKLDRRPCGGPRRGSRGRTRSRTVLGLWWPGEILDRARTPSRRNVTHGPTRATDVAVGTHGSRLATCRRSPGRAGNRAVLADRRAARYS